MSDTTQVEIQVARLEEQMKTITAMIEKQQESIDQLTALANQGKGSIWMFITLGGFVGAAVSNIVGLKKLFGA
jgi:prefoldin subunit 5